MSKNYKFEVEKHRYISQNRGCDKVSLYNKADQAWSQSKFLIQVHNKNLVNSDISREGRKLDLASYHKKSAKK